MIHVRIHDHLTHRDHESSWDVPGRGMEPIVGAIRAAFVRAFGSSAGPIEDLGNGQLYVRGMRVFVSVEAPALPFVDPAKESERLARRRKRWQERADEINARRRARRVA